MVVKSLVDSRHHLCPGNLEGHEKPEEGEVLKEFIKASECEPEKVVDDLDSTEDGEASEKAHGASYQTQLGFHCHLQIGIMICSNYNVIKERASKAIDLTHYDKRAG